MKTIQYKINISYGDGDVDREYIINPLDFAESSYIFIKAIRNFLIPFSNDYYVWIDTKAKHPLKLGDLKFPYEYTNDAQRNIKDIVNKFYQFIITDEEFQNSYQPNELDEPRIYIRLEEINPLTEDEYYKLINNMEQFTTPIEKVEAWYLCFNYLLRNYNMGYRTNPNVFSRSSFHEDQIRALFYEFQMSNWKALHKRNNPEYSESTVEELYQSFCSECIYISDRASFDRLFRTHWLFIYSMELESNPDFCCNMIDRIMYPNLYKKTKL